MADRAELRRLIERARERGMSDAEVRELGRRYVQRTGETEPIPESMREPWMLPQSTPEGDPDPDKFERSVDPRMGAVQLVGNVPKSAWNVAKGIGQFFENPPGVLSLGPGGDVRVGEEGLVGAARHLPGYISSRYGSPGKALDTLVEDPAGVALDVRGGYGVAKPAVVGGFRAGASAMPAVGRTLAKAPRHVARNAAAYGGAAVSAYTGDLSGFALGKMADWIRNRSAPPPPARPATRVETAVAEADAAGESLFDYMLREAKRKRYNPDFWSDEPLPPRGTPQGPQPPSGGTSAATPASTPIFEEALRREQQTVDPKFYAPKQFLDEELVGINANKARNLGAIEFAGESYAQLKRLLREAVRAGDVTTARILDKLISQREQITEAAMKRGGK